ncbi:hypothetical protein GCM10011529_02240 [Polymorphobacter glacialis]|uniref:DUF1697 domain-containing protein n=1 Tax=Sandarakinorhabdus glacialis TaxID=1614636 RepID=A0A916ZJK9_9SPHN|nr:DUF1697 domain-containing protein [Polymorphobacter glacialis]GGD99652.1 hypothetical protein GCM10011529_02240 [Polymorphobacter glacialis]
MTGYVALVRAVNVGGTGKLPMAVLAAMGAAAGFAGVRTYIASGNLVFSSDLDAAAVQAALADRLAAYAGRPVGVLVRTAAEMAAVVAGNPFPDVAGNRLIMVFVDGPLDDVLVGVSGQGGERIVVGERAIYVAYDAGMGSSKLKIPGAGAGTGRNMNSVRKLAEMAGAEVG